MAGDTSVRRDEGSTIKRERMLSMVGGVLGILMFLWGFLRWFKVGDAPDQRKYSGFAFQMPTTAVIGFALAAGLMALLGATERRAGRGVPSAIPTALAATSFLLAVGVAASSAQRSPTVRRSRRGVVETRRVVRCSALAGRISAFGDSPPRWRWR